MKAAVVDLGYNSVKMVIYHVDPAGRFRAVRQDAFDSKLGEGMDETGLLGEEAIERTIGYLKILREIAEMESVGTVLALATSAVREAGNGDEFLARTMRETKLVFRVLAGKDEALYSCAGALGSIPATDVVFFDLGGGSLEIARAVGFRVRRVLSLPLGALRLSLDHGHGDGTFDKADADGLKEHVASLVPGRKEFGVRKSTRLIGVGGTVRMLARYHQRATDYPFHKIQGYSISQESISWMSRAFLKMSRKELAKDEVTGPRADTIAAGACVVKMMMRSLELEELTVSANGLREGALSMYLYDKKAFHSGRVTAWQVERFVAHSAESVLGPTPGSILAFERPRLVNRSGAAVLAEGIRLVSHARLSVNPRSLFNSLLGEDSPLSHREQLYAVLAVVGTKNLRLAAQLSNEYWDVTTNAEKKRIRRLSSLLALAGTLENVGASVVVSRRRGRLDFKFRRGRRPLPAALLSSQADTVGQALKLKVSVSYVGGLREVLPRMGVAR